MSDLLDEGLKEFDRMLGIEEEIPGDDTPVVAEEGTPAGTPAEPEAEAEAPTPDPEERPRNEKGQFAKKDEEAPAEEPELILGKFKSYEDLAKSYQELESRMGQQGGLGSSKLEDTLERLNRNLERVEQEPEQAPVEVDPAWIEEQLEENPAALAHWAKDNAPHVLGRVVKEWGELDPFAAASFVTDVRLEAQEKKFEQILRERTSPYEETHAQTAIERAFAAAGITDLETRAESILEAAKFAPEVAKGLQSRDADERVAAAKKLSFLASGMTGGLQSQGTASAEQTAAREAAQALDQAATDAKLSGTAASQTQTGEAEQKSEGEQWLEDIGFDAYLDAHSPSE